MSSTTKPGLASTITADAAQAREALVFTRWMNGYLAQTKHNIPEDRLLAGALDDGTILWFFLTTLSGKKLPPMETGKQAGTKLAHTQNLNASLNFLASEGIKLMNIGAEDIQARKANLILGMIWTIFLRYQMRGQTSVRDAKRATVEWLQDDLGLDVADLTNSFEDGHNYIHLVNALTDNIIEEKYITDDAKKNAELALTVAQHVLGIPKLVNAEDLVGSGIDEKILLVFLSSFMDVQRKVAETGFGWLVFNSIPQVNSPKQLETCVSVNMTCHKPMKFHIKTNNVQSLKQLNVKALGFDGSPASISFSKSDVGGDPNSKYHTWGVTVNPNNTGPMEIFVTLSAEGHDEEGREIPPTVCGGMPIKAIVEVGPSDYLYVPNKTCPAGRVGRAEIMSDFTIIAKYEDGTSVPITDMTPFIVSFLPPRAGKVTLTITREDRPIDGSPTIITVLDPPKVTWLSPAGSSVFYPGQEVCMNLNGSDISPEHFVLKVKDTATGKAVDCQITTAVIDANTFQAKFAVDNVGKFSLEAIAEGAAAGQGFNFEVKEKPVIQLGSGITQGTVGEVCKVQFRVKHMSTSDLKVVATCQSGEVPVKLVKGSEGKVTVEFTPTGEQGTATLVASGPGSEPLTVTVPVKSAPSAKIQLDHLADGRVHSLYEITFDAVNLLPVDFLVAVTTEKKKQLPVSVTPNGDGSVWTASFTPDAVGPLSVSAQVKGKPIPGSPFSMNVGAKPSAVLGSAPKKSQTGKPVLIDLTTNVNSLDKGELEISLDLNGQPLSFEYNAGKIKCQPESLGKLVFSCSLEGQVIQGCPVVIEIAPGPTATLVGSTDRQVALGKIFSFSIDTTYVVNKSEQLKVVATDDHGKGLDVALIEHTSFNTAASSRPISQAPSGKPAAALKPGDAKKPTNSALLPGGLGKKPGSGGSNESLGDKRALSRQVSARPKMSHENTFVGSFKPVVEGKHKVVINLEGREVAVLNVLVLSTAAGKISGMEGEVMVGNNCICLFDLIDVAPGDIDVVIKYADGSTVPGKIEPHDQSFAMKFVPTVEGDAKVEAKMKGGKQLMGSPFDFEVFPIPWVKIDIDTSQRRAFLGEQFFFQIVSSQNVRPSDLLVRATDMTTKEVAEFNPVAGRRAKAYSTTSVVTAGQKVLYYDCYWCTTCNGNTSVKTEILLNGVDAPQTPFTMSVEGQPPIFAKTLPFSKLQEKSPMPVDPEKGIEFVIAWQTKTTVRKVPLHFTCAVFNDLGERVETLSPGQYTSRDHDGITIVPKLEGKEVAENAQSIFISPAHLRCDTKCIPIFVAASELDFSHINKFVFCVNKTKGKLNIPGYVMKAPKKETALCIGFMARENDVWQFHVAGTFSFSRFITDLVPLQAKQIKQWTPYIALSGPQHLRRARALPLHPNVDKLDIEITCNWKSRLASKSQSMRNLGIVILTATVLCYKFGESKPSVINDGDPVINGIFNNFNENGKTTVETSRVPADLQTLLLVATQAVGPKETGLASLENTVIKLRAQNKASEKPGVHVSPFSTGYELADFTATRDEIGAVASLILCKLTKRSPEAPWEFVAIGTGAAEISVDELIYPRKKASNKDLVVADDTPRNIGLDSYLTQFWRPTPSSLRLYVLSGIGLPSDKAGNCTPFVQFVPIAKMTYDQFDKQKTESRVGVNPVWGESFEFKKIANHPRKDLSVLATVWDQGAVSPVFLGEFKVPLKKLFSEALKNPLKSGETTLKLEKSSSKSFKTTRSVTGEVRLRYICF